jgi:inorganic pyrophosphatase
MKKRGKEKSVEIIVETPKGSRNKYRFDEQKKIMTLKKILPTGFSFPFDFGLIPGTKGEDGDPLDIIIITQQSIFPGCHVDCRIVGGIKAKQAENGKEIRNDRFVAIPVCDDLYSSIENIDDLPKELVSEITDFFVAYRKHENVDFVPLSLLTSREVKKIIKSSK